MVQFCYLSLYLGTETVSSKDGRGLKDTPRPQGAFPWPWRSKAREKRPGGEVVECHACKNHQKIIMIWCTLMNFFFHIVLITLQQHFAWALSNVLTAISS